jgi:uncharacterized RDD family membrane protein YckC
MASSDLAHSRIYAWLIDLLIAMGFGGLFGGLGWIVSIGYWLLRDGCFEGQSIGKRLMRLKVVAGPDRQRCTFINSSIRNLLWAIPFVNVLTGLTGLYYLTKDRAGQHWGDRLADTRVVKAAA